MDVVIMPLWAWILFYVLVLVMLLIDLKMFGRKGQHEVGIGEALKMTAVWIGVSLIFCGGIWYYEGADKGMEFLAGYLIEKSLSMDNLFVFLMLFSFFGVKPKYQHEVLFWGIFGALVLRSIFIFAGAAMVQRFEWILGIFGVFLIYTGIKMFSHKDDENVDPSKNIFVKIFKRFFPVTDKMHDDKFFVMSQETGVRSQDTGVRSQETGVRSQETGVRSQETGVRSQETGDRSQESGDRSQETGGRWLATPLFIALIVIETTDVAFAVDSIPAVFSVSRDPFIVLTSNIFAILGLRALYFALAAIAKYFQYLNYGLGIILSFVGVKMLLEVLWGIKVSTPLSLAIIFGVLMLSMLASYGATLYSQRRQ